MSKNTKVPPILVVSSAGGPFRRTTCGDCETELLLSKTDIFCAACSSDVSGQGKEVNLANKIEASAQKNKATIHCVDCNANMMVRNTKETAEYNANSMYCSVCGSADLEEAEPDEVVPDVFVPVKKEELNIDDVKDPEADVSTDVDNADPEKEKLKEDEVQNVIDDVQNNVTADFDSIEASFVTNPEDAWVLFVAGQPAVRIAKSATPIAAHAIFSTEQYIDTFVNRVKENGFVATAEEYGAELYPNAKLISSNELEKAAYERMESQVLPRLLDCIATVIEGTVKGIYPEIQIQMKHSLFDELVASGITEDKSIHAIESAFNQFGPDVFNMIISKALEINRKDDKAFQEIKATIQASGVVKSSKPEVVDSNLQRRLVAGNLKFASQSEPIVAASGGGNASQVRDRVFPGKR